MTGAATTRLLDFVAADHRLPAPIHDRTCFLLGDTLMAGTAGAASAEASKVLAAARGWGDSGPARLLGGGTLPATGAAFANAFCIHCLEWDAVHEPAVVHALSVVTAVLGAVIDRRGGCDPQAALTALAIGVDVASGLGIAAEGGLGFFRPAVAGTIGAALAAARLDGVPRDRLGHVLGLAHAQCAGTMQAHVEGSIALPLQIAAGARAAVSALDLVNAGLDGPQDALEGPFGHFALFDQGRLATYTDTLGHWRIAEVSFKPYPSGRASHAVLSAIEPFAPSLAEIAAIEAHVPPLVARLVDRPHHAGMTPAYARLCLPFLAGLMLTDGRIDPRRFTPDIFAYARVAEAGRLLSIHVDGNPDPNALSPQRLDIRFRDGRARSIAIAATPGSPGHPDNERLAAAKTALARELARATADPRLIADPIDYFTKPENA